MRKSKRIIAIALVLFCAVLSWSTIYAAAKSATDNSSTTLASKGLTVTYSDENSKGQCVISDSSGVYYVDIKAQGYNFMGFIPVQTTTKVTIENTSEYVISFDVKVGNETQTYTGDPGKTWSESTWSVTSTSTSAPTTKTIVISNIVLSLGATEITVCSAEGNGTFSVLNERAKDANENDKVDGLNNPIYVTDENGNFTYSATPAEGYEFFGFKKTDGTYIVDAGGSFQIEEAITLTPVFVPANVAMFQTNSVTYPYLDLALTAAANGDKKVRLVRSGDARGSVSDTSFTIPEGVTLLVPFSSSDAGLVGESGSTETVAKAGKAGFALTILEGTTLNVGDKATLNVSGTQGRGQAPYMMGSMVGDYGLLTVKGTVVVLSGGTFHARGIVDGNGTVNAKSGANIHQLAEIVDYRGGTATMGIYSKVFPFNQLYIQNIQATTTYEYGSHLYAGAFVLASIGDLPVKKYTNVHSIGKDTDTALFVISSGGKIVFNYDKEKAQSIIDVYGSVSSKAISVQVTSGLVGGTINSADHQCPLSGAFSVNVKDKATFTITEEFKILPGCAITIESGGAATISYTSATSFGALYLYDVNHYDFENYDAKNVYYEYRKYPSTAGSTLQGKVISETENGSLIVNGVLTVDGYLYTSAVIADDVVTSYGTSITTTQNTGKIICNRKGENATINTTNGTSQTLNSSTFSPAYGLMANGLAESAWAQFAVGTYYSNGSAWYTHADVYYDDDETTVLDTLYYVGEPASVTHPASAKDDGTYTYVGSWSEWAQGPKPSINYTTYNNYKVSYTKSGIVIYADAGRTDDGDVQVEYFLKDYIWLDLTCYVGDQITALGDVSVVLTINGKTYPAQIINDGSAIYVVAQVTARQIPEIFSFVFGYGGYSSAPINIKFEDRVKRENWNESLITAMLKYGNAAKLYFGGGKYTGTLPTLQSLGVSDNRQSVADSLVAQDNISIRTTGVTGVFAERIAFTMHMGIKQGGTAVKPSVLFDTYGDDIMQIGLLVGDAQDGLLSTGEGKHEAAYLLYSREALEGASGLVDGLPDGVVGAQHATLSKDALADLDEWTVTFDLTTEEYAKKFSLRLFVVVKTGDDQYKVLYGTQYHYGLSDYIARTYNSTTGFSENAEGDLVNEDGCYLTSYTNFMAATWEYMNAAGNTKWPEDN